MDRARKFNITQFKNEYTFLIVNIIDEMQKSYKKMILNYGQKYVKIFQILH